MTNASRRRHATHIATSQDSKHGASLLRIKRACQVHAQHIPCRVGSCRRKAGQVDRCCQSQRRSRAAGLELGNWRRWQRLWLPLSAMFRITRKLTEELNRELPLVLNSAWARRTDGIQLANHSVSLQASQVIHYLRDAAGIPNEKL